jgi:hypothetical protein
MHAMLKASQYFLAFGLPERVSPLSPDMGFAFLDFSDALFGAGTDFFFPNSISHILILHLSWRIYPFQHIISWCYHTSQEAICLD